MSDKIKEKEKLKERYFEINDEVMKLVKEKSNIHKKLVEKYGCYI